MTKVFEKDIAYLDKTNSWQQKMGVKIAKLGVLPVPIAVIKFKRNLKLTSSEILFIGLIYGFKQGAEWPYFSLAKITREGGFCQDTLHRAKKGLIKKGYLRIYSRKENPRGKGRNVYSLTGLEFFLEKLIDKARDDLFKTDRWSREDYLEYALLKDTEREKLSENQRAIDGKSREDNKSI
jgi:hypothetical protein